MHRFIIRNVKGCFMNSTDGKKKCNEKSIVVISNILCVPYIDDLLNQKYKGELELFISSYIRYEEYYEKKVDLSNSDIVIIWLNFECKFPNALVSCKTNVDYVSSIYSSMIQEVMKLYNDVKKKTNGLIFLVGLEDYTYEITQIIGVIPLMNAVVDRINISLIELIEKGDYFIDLKRLIAEVGRSNSYNDSWKYRWNAPYSQTLIARVTDEIYKHYSALYQKSKKCLILDCDNVLWGGTLVEDGIENLQLGNDFGREYQDFQRYILYLYNLGICICVCSKNSENEVRKVFQEHSGMILKENHIELFWVNWDSKAKGIRHIARQLNIGLDSIIFIDDSQNEINEVSALLPEVECVLFNKRRIYTDLKLFLTDAISTYDVRVRHDFYKNIGLRRKIEMNCSSEKDYALSLNTIVSFERTKQIEINRITELLFRANKRTNGTRLTKMDIHNNLENDRYIHLSVIVSDKFSDLGLVGYICICDDIIFSFVLSCRAMGRGIEAEMIKYAKMNGAKSFIFSKTGKNDGLYNMFIENGLILV